MHSQEEAVDLWPETPPPSPLQNPGWETWMVYQAHYSDYCWFSRIFRISRQPGHDVFMAIFWRCWLTSARGAATMPHENWAWTVVEGSIIDATLQWSVKASIALLLSIRSRLYVSYPASSSYLDRLLSVLRCLLTLYKRTSHCTE